MTLWLAVAAPLAGAILIAVAGGALGRRGVAAVGAGALAVSFGASVALAQAFAAGRTSLVADLGPWLPLRGSALALRLDPSTVPLILVTTAVAALLALHSIGSLSRTEGTRRYFAALDLIVSATLLVILARDLVLLLAGCEIAAASAYLLITHRAWRPGDADAGIRSFVTGRVGDAALLLGAFVLLGLFGTADLDEIGSRLAAIRLTSPADSTLFVATALLVSGALARSAQLPFHGWLPATLAAPEPAAALLHTVSGIQVGVIVLVRLAPLLHPGALVLAAAIGGATALLGAIVSLAESDRRRAIAWSTASHAGLMFAAVGAGAPGVALFQLLSHALAKATLLLAPDVAERAPNARAFGFVSGVLGLGLLPPAATFFSASALASAFADRPLLLGVLLAVALVSGLRAARLIASTFLAPATGARVSHARGSGPLALVPVVSLGVLAAGTLTFGGLVFAGAVSLGTAVAPTALTTGQIAVAAASLAGAAVGLWSYGRRPRALTPSRPSLALARMSRADALVARGFAALAGLLAIEGEGIVRRSVDALGWLVQRGALITGRIESGGVRADQAVLWTAVVTLLAYWTLR